MNENIEGLSVWKGVGGRFSGGVGVEWNDFLCIIFFRLIFIFTHFLRVVFATLLSCSSLWVPPKKIQLFSLLLVYPRVFFGGVCSIFFADKSYICVCMCATLTCLSIYSTILGPCVCEGNSKRQMAKRLKLPGCIWLNPTEILFSIYLPFGGY